jgi:lipopolysaccharide transport system ATP-binding protein
MSHIAIRVERLSKQYKIAARRLHHDTLRDQLMGSLKSIFQRNGSPDPGESTIWALRDVSFEVKQGEIIGIIGRNGAGKSTLLKVLSRITGPTTGSAEIFGRVGSLLEVGTGFSRELNGRENIYLSGAILGMKKSEITRKMDEIVSFAEVERFLDTPVKHYSSGMYLRLAFAVAAHLEPEIMLVDEVLAVGDASFQKRCLGKMEEVHKGGRTVFFVSHNLAAITSLCTRCLLIEDGRLVRSGSPHSLRFTKVSILNDRLEVIEHATSGQDISIALEYEIRNSQKLENVIIQIAFTGAFGQPLFACLSRVAKDGVLTLNPGSRILCRITRLPLLPGTYTFDIWAKVGETMEDGVVNAGTLSVAQGDYFGTGKLPPKEVGEFVVTHNWSVG